MIAFCTYCSWQKNPAEGNLPAIHRYRSERITSVWSAAQAVRVPFLILSAEFGLLAPERPIPYYDHLLTTDEVEMLVDKLAPQIQTEGISGIVYFTRSFAQDPNARLYHDALAAACARLQTMFLSITIADL